MFSSAKQKIDRAEYHIADIERQFAAFVAEKPHRFSVQGDPPTGGMFIKVRIMKEMPSGLALVIGDAVHNLRCALDHAVWELVGRDNGTQDRYLKFPTGDNRINFEASCNGIKTPSQWVKDAVIATEAFRGGRGIELYRLHLLDNVDKHTIIAPVVRATSHPPFKVVNEDGTVMATMKGNVMVQGVDAFPLARIAPRMSIELEDDAECPPSIFSYDALGVVMRPTIGMLREMKGAVVEALDSLDRASEK